MNMLFKNMLNIYLCIIFTTTLSAQTNLEIPISKNGQKGVVLKRTRYTVSFSKEYNIPNWVEWKPAGLLGDRLGMFTL